jgi:hypothetical protein
MDIERLSAEKRAIDLGANEKAVSEMSDDELRIEIFRLARPSVSISPEKRSVMAKLEERTGVNAESLLEEFGIQVADDGLIEAGQITDVLGKIIGDLPVAFYHHTSTALLPRIQREGLRVGEKTNFFNTQSGVYVSTIAAGAPVSTYSARAAKVHGGYPTTIRLRRTLNQVQPDPDDSDLSWAQGKQFITPNVPASDLMWDSDEVESEDNPARDTQRG